MGVFGTLMGIFFVIIFLAALICPVVFTALNILHTVVGERRPVFEAALYLTGIFLSMILGGELPKYSSSLTLGSTPYMHEFLASDYAGSVFLVFFVGLVSYFFLKFWKKEMPPLFLALCMAGTYTGCLLNLALLTQLAGGFAVCYTGRVEGDTLFFMLYMSLLPLNYLMNAVVCLVGRFRRTAELQAEIEYKNRALARVNAFFNRGSRTGWAAVLLILPILLVCAVILILFGQTPDSIIKAFTETSDWTLSTKISPPPVEYDGHYLCTVALRGHRRVVRPLRYGVRHGRKIVVNRQLCVANAFEDLLAERVPRVQRNLRMLYDRFGYPISKFIRKAWAADVVYLFMKPLEWLFVAVLYLFDERPEDRIARQYLPAGWKGER